MKSMMYSALMMFALAMSGCAMQNGGSCSDCGILSNLGNGGAVMQASDCGCSGGAAMGAQSDCGCSGNAAQGQNGDCGCGNANRPKLDCSIVRKLGDARGMGLRLNEKGFACNQNRGSDLFSRIRNRGSRGAMATSSVPMAAMADESCGCDSCESAPMMMDEVVMDGGCGCGDMSCGDGGCGVVEEAVELSEVGGLLGRVGSKGCGCSLKGLFGNCKLGNCKLGNCKLGGCKLGNCNLGRKLFSRAGSAVADGRCGIAGCGVGGALCGGCMAKFRGGRQPYGGAIPHTAQAPGAGTGSAPSYAYPYYTTRGPRDFLVDNPPTIGY